MKLVARTMAILVGNAALATAALGQGHAPAAAPAAPAARSRVQAPAADPLEAAFEAAARGDLAPLSRAREASANADIRALIDARLAAARFDPAPAAAPAIARLAAGDDPALRRAALSILTEAALASGDYAAAAQNGRQLAEAYAAAGKGQEAEGAERTWRLAALLAGRPGQRVEGNVGQGSTPARLDRVGLPRIDVTVNGQMQEAVFDTGANLSVLSTDTARRLGVTILDGETPIGNGVQGVVQARVGIADRVEIAGTVLRNVVFLIIDDAQLTFPVPGGYDIKAIIGLPVMRPLGRMRMERAGRFVLLPAADGGGVPADAPNMHASGNSLFVETMIDGRPVPLLLDTGANQSSLTALYAQANGAAIAALPTTQAGRASAGGAQLVRVATWRDAPLALAGRTLRLPTLTITLPAEGAPEPRSYGTIGASVLLAFDSYTLDFAAMRFELGEPVRPTP